jgi:hypothetical protein
MYSAVTRGKDEIDHHCSVVSKNVTVCAPDDVNKMVSTIKRNLTLLISKTVVPGKWAVLCNLQDHI